MRIGFNEAFDALEVSADLKKIAFFFAAGLLALGGGRLLLWLGSITANPALSFVLNAAAALYLYTIWVIATAGISLMSYKELTSGEKISILATLTFCKKKAKDLMLSPLALAAVIALAAGVEYLLFWLGRFGILQIIFSIISAPVILFNVFCLFAVICALFLIIPIVVVDDCGPISATKKILSAAKSSWIQILMFIVPLVLVGLVVIASAAGLLSFAAALTLALFGSASGIFAELSKMDAAAISMQTQIAWQIYSFFAIVLGGAVFAFMAVFIKTAAVTLYLGIKERN